MKKTGFLLLILNAFLWGNAAEFFPLDLRKQATTGFQDSVANDYMGGWFDEGNNDLRIFPSGRRTFAGVPFDIMDPVANAGATCIVLRSIRRPYFPEAVRKIPVNLDQVDFLHILHTGGGNMQTPQGRVYRCIIHYEDGAHAEIPVRWNQEIGNWWIPRNLPHADLAWADYNPVGRLVGVWRLSAANPHPRKKIVSLDFLSDNSDAFCAVLAVTFQRGKPLPVLSGETVRLKTARDSKEFTIIPKEAAIRSADDRPEAEREKQIRKIRMQMEEFRIMNELMAVKVPEKRNTPVERKTKSRIGILEFRVQPELLHFYKTRSEIERLLNQTDAVCRKVTLQELMDGTISVKEIPLLLDHAGDPFPYTHKKEGDCFQALVRYLEQGGAILNLNGFPFGRPMTLGPDGRWSYPNTYSKQALLRTRPAFSSAPGEGDLYLKLNLPDVPGKFILPVYCWRDYRVLNEDEVRKSGWKMLPLAELYQKKKNGTDRKIGISAVLLHGHQGRFAKGALGWMDPQTLKRMSGIWADSRTPSKTGRDPRQQDPSPAGRKLLQLAIDTIHRKGILPASGEKMDQALRQAEQDLVREKERFERLSAALQNPPDIPPKKISIRDGMFLVNGKPKILWGTEISGYPGQGGNGVTSPLGKFYLRGAAQLFQFDYAVFTLFPILREFNGRINPRVKPGSWGAKQDWRGNLRRAAKETTHNGWALEMNSVFMTYNEFLKKDPAFFPEHSDFSILACPENPDTWVLMRKLYKECLDDVLQQGGNLNVIELDNESMYRSCSEANIRMFREYLKKQYSSIEQLNASWGGSRTSFDSIVPPVMTRADARKNGIAPVIDWIKFQQMRYVQVIRQKRALIENLLNGRKVLFSIQPFATLSGGEDRHSYALRGCDYEAMPELVDILSSERLFTPWRDGASPEEMPAMIGNAGYLFTEMMRCVSEHKLPVLNTEGAMTKYGSRKTAAEYQLAVWSHIIHGDQAVVPTYWCFFAAPDSVCHPANNEPDVLAEMTRIGKSLQRFGELVAPVPRIQGNTALFVSFESMRDIRRNFGLETEFYSGVFSRRPLDLITGNQILRGGLKKYRALLLTGAHLVPEEVLAAIRRYVAEGGIVLATPETFRGNEYGKPISCRDFFPLHSEGALLDHPLPEIGKPGTSAVWNLLRLTLLFQAPELSVQGKNKTTVLARSPEGVPVLAVRSYGKGKVYQFGGIPSAVTSLQTWKAILEREGIVPDLEVHGEDADFFVETQLVERKNGFLLYAANFYREAKSITIPAERKMRRGPYRILSLITGQEFPTASGTPVWSGKEDLLKLQLPPHGVEVLYFERKKERKKRMNRIKLFSMMMLHLSVTFVSADIAIQPDGILRIGNGELLVRHYHPQWRTSVPRHRQAAMPSSGGVLKTPWKLFDGTEAEWEEKISKEQDGIFRIQYLFRSTRPARTALLAAELTLPVKEFLNTTLTADGKEIILNAGKNGVVFPLKKVREVLFSLSDGTIRINFPESASLEILIVAKQTFAV